MWRASKLYRQSIVYFLLRGIAKHLNILLGEYPRAINRNLSWKRISVCPIPFLTSFVICWEIGNSYYNWYIFNTVVFLFVYFLIDIFIFIYLFIYFLRGNRTTKTVANIFVTFFHMSLTCFRSVLFCWDFYFYFYFQQ